MTGLDGRRVYLDWNATAPLRPEARAAMLEAMDLVGNPSSVHSEGRAAKAIVEKARAQVAELVGCDPAEIVFTSGATEVPNGLFAGHRFSAIYVGAADHDAFIECARSMSENTVYVYPKEQGRHPVSELDYRAPEDFRFEDAIVCICAANGETGVLEDTDKIVGYAHRNGAPCFLDTVQLIGKRSFSFSATGADLAVLSAHKIGGPKGSGALFARREWEHTPLHYGGGQELGRRSGTENVIGIAGFGAAAAAAKRDLEAGVWERVETLRDELEDDLARVAPEAIFFGKEAPRLPNTSCFAVPGWKGETQVMQMDLAGFAVSAGSACSSGKVRPSRVLTAMGFDETTAASAIRVSMGPITAEAEVRAFAEAWKEQYRRRKSRAA